MHAADAMRLNSHMILQLHLMNVAAHCNGNRAGEAGAAASVVLHLPHVDSTGPKAALALEQEVVERARQVSELDLGAARLTDGQSSALALLLPAFVQGLECLRLSGAGFLICHLPM